MSQIFSGHCPAHAMKCPLRSVSFSEAHQTSPGCAVQSSTFQNWAGNHTVAVRQRHCTRKGFLGDVNEGQRDWLDAATRLTHLCLRLVSSRALVPGGQAAGWACWRPHYFPSWTRHLRHPLLQCPWGNSPHQPGNPDWLGTATRSGWVDARSEPEVAPRYGWIGLAEWRRC